MPHCLMTIEMINLHRVEFKDIWKIKVNGTTHGVLGVVLSYLHLGITELHNVPVVFYWN